MHNWGERESYPRALPYLSKISPFLLPSLFPFFRLFSSASPPIKTSHAFLIHSLSLFAYLIKILQSCIQMHPIAFPVR